jgi:hypothetical protein
MKKNWYFPSPATGISPLIIDGDKIVVSGNMSGEYIDENENNRPVSYIFDIRTEQIEYIVSYPKLYNDYNWGGGLFRWVYSDDKTKYFVENHSYSNVIYDMYNDVFYRIAELKIEYNGLPGWRKKLSIIILNSDFNIVGETQIGDSHAPTYRYTMFVTSKGLHIQQKSDEDQMLFNIYKLIPNEK